VLKHQTHLTVEHLAGGRHFADQRLRSVEDIEAAEQDIEAAGTSAAVGLGTLVAVAGRNPVPDVGHDLEAPDRSLGQMNHRKD